MSHFSNDVVVITGAGSGIGRALAKEFALGGAELALADVNAASVEETRSLLGNAKAGTYVCDVGDASAVEAFARKVRQDFGRATIVVNNAGVALYGSFEQLTVAEFDWLFRVNFWGVIHGCKFFLPLLREQRQGRIVNMSSVFGLIAPPGQTAYGASKYAVRGFSESLREELRGSGVAVTCVHPAGIRTNIANNGRAGAATDLKGQAQARELFNRVAVITPEEAARTIVRGILRNKDRVLIGADAYRMDRMARMFPTRAAAMFAKWMEKRREKMVRALSAAGN
ncbi:MAG TPA: SDR family NAD(P)-dependent oxidoreductase [Candidatus Angelobacter sp.]|nr:SDR family NAD(P)-dependent oxidoreductase [Candidatus Angelobacter sp.]